MLLWVHTIALPDPAHPQGPDPGDRVAAVLASGGSGSQPALSRRAALGAAVLLAATGCDLNAESSRPPPSEAGPASASSTATPSTPTQTAAAGTGAASPDADLLLLDQTREAIATMLEVVVATRRAKPTLRGPLRRLQDMHQAHLGALDSADPDTISRTEKDLTADEPSTVRSPSGTDVRSAVVSLERREPRLQQPLADASLAAASGEFARLLASMHASMAQHLTLLPRVR